MATCADCGKKLSLFDETGRINGKEVCMVCLKKVREETVQLEQVRKQAEEQLKKEVNVIPLVTLSSLPDREIKQYFDMITAEAVIGTGILSELAADFSDFFGTTSSAFEGKIGQAKQYAISRLKYQAHNLGANAIIGAKTDYLVTANNMFMIAVSGTPVKVE